MNAKEKKLAEGQSHVAYLEHRLSLWRDGVLEDLQHFEDGVNTFEGEEELDLLQGYASRIVRIVEAVSKKAGHLVTVTEMRKIILRHTKGQL